MMNREEVILVDINDNPTGVADKMSAHLEGKLHRAFSIFIFNTEGKMLLQRRALSKYHSGGLWTNACCSHPLPNENTLAAASRRLKEELGFETAIEKIFDFVYKAEFENGLTEYEFDHVFAGEFDGAINFNKEEVMEMSVESISSIKESMSAAPEKYTAWFQIAFPNVEAWWNEQIKNKVA